jgi:tRNA-dihydrouridine synthase B
MSDGNVRHTYGWNRPLRLGPVALETPVLAAPVAGFTDLLYREVLREFGGCGLMFTEMVSASLWIHGGIEPERLEGVPDEPRPLGVQLWDRCPRTIREAAFKLRAFDVSVIDLNFGCPKRRIMGKQGAGATLLRDPQTVGELVAAAVAGAGKIPVTAKIRLGRNRDEQTAVEVAQSAEANGAVAVTVHGRTAADGYGDEVDLDAIARVAEAVSIPVIANGDVSDAPSALRTLRHTGAAGIMVARAALTRPWVFREITAALRGEAIPPPPTTMEQVDQLLRHHGAMVARFGDFRGTIRMRKFACGYLPGTAGVAAFRRAISQAADAAEFRDLVDEYVRRLETHERSEPADLDPRLGALSRFRPMASSGLA